MRKEQKVVTDADIVDWNVLCQSVFNTMCNAGDTLCQRIQHRRRTPRGELFQRLATG